MPQKKNPDVPELVRGKTGRVYGHLLSLLTTLKGLPMSYNRDLQEDKPALFDAFDQAEGAVEVMTALMGRLTVDRESLTRALSGGGMLATEIADYLVTKGVPFREAHAVTGRIVRWALDQGRELGELSVEELRRFSGKFDSSVLERLTIRGAIDRKAQIGGTSSRQVDRRLRDWARALA
jgi:argininosuccinate lyase